MESHTEQAGKTPAPRIEGEGAVQVMTQTCMISTSISLMTSRTKETGLVEARMLPCELSILATVLRV